MQIIKNGTPKALVEDMIAECSACGCVFIFGTHESMRVPNNGGGDVYFAQCPECVGTGAFDTGYKRDNDKDHELDRRVMERQAALRSLIKAKECSGPS